MKSSIRSLALLVLVVCSPASFANDLPGSQDLERVPRLPDARIVDYRQSSDLERIYPMGSIRRISGQLRFDGQADARGDVTSITYELAPEHSSTQAFTAAREALQKQGAELLFWCQARDCGESSLWANQVFGNAKLYGADNGQAFLLLRLAPPADNTLIALYGITRGNRKGYLHVEQLEAGAALGDLLPTSATLLRQLKDTGVLDLPRLAGEPDSTWLGLLSRALNLDTGLRVTMAGASAEAWREGLVGLGVRAARMEIANQDAAGLRLELLR